MKTITLSAKGFTEDECLQITGGPGYPAAVIGSRVSRRQNARHEWILPAFQIFEMIAALDRIRPEAAQLLRTAPEYADARQEAREFDDVVRMSWATHSPMKIPCPSGKAYLPFQVAGIEYAHTLDGVLFGDDMGLGKTMQAIGLMNYHGIEDALIVSPTSVKTGWERQLHAWDAHGNFRVISTAKGISPADLKAKAIHVIGYDGLRTMPEAFIDRRRDMVILDEIHFTKNIDTARSKLAHKAMRRADIRVGLSGSPIINRPREIYHLVKAIQPKLFNNSVGFYELFCAPEVTPMGISYDGAANLDVLQELLRGTIMVRRKKKQVFTQLRDKDIHRIVVPSTPSVRNLLDKEKDALPSFKALLKATSPKEIDALLNRLVVEAASHAGLRAKTAEAKLPFCIATVTDLLESVEKVVFFAHHRVLTEGVRDHFGRACACVLGGLSQKERQKQVDAFIHDPSKTVFVGSIGAAGTGLDGLQLASSVMVVGEFPWTDAELDQLESRIHRIGQDGQATYYYMVVEGSVDEHVLGTIYHKRSIAKEALG